MTKLGYFSLFYVVGREHNNVTISDVDKNLQGSNVYLLAKFSCLTPDGLEGVC